MIEGKYEFSPMVADQKPEIGQKWRQYLVGIIANFGIFAVSYVMVWTSPVLPKLRDHAQNPLPYPLTTDEEAWVGALLSFGAMFGPFISIPLASSLGRKWGLLISTVPLLVGLILVLMAKSVMYLYIARTAWGVSVGMFFTISPMYCNEIATVDARGSLGSFLITFLTFGYLVMYCVGPYVSYSVVAYIGIVFAVIFCMTFFFMPETPKYLMMKDRREAAAASLIRLRGKSRAGVEPELAELTAEIQDSSNSSASITEMLKLMFVGGAFKGFLISCVLLIAQQTSGVNAVLFYLSTIFEKAGSKLPAHIATIIIGAVLFIFCTLLTLVVERLGRKMLMMISCAGSSVGLAIFGVSFYLDSIKSPIMETLSVLPLMSLILYIVMYSMGLGPLPWVYLSELVPMEVKAVASPIATAFCWMLSFFVTRYFELLSNTIGSHSVFWLCAVCCALSFIFTLFLVPETKGKTAMEIKDLLEGRRQQKNEEK